MFPGLSLPRPERAPRSAEEAVKIAQTLLRQAALEGSSATLLQPASGADGFAGARVELLLPEKSLESILRRALEEKAREQGAQIKGVELVLSPVDERCVRLQARVSATMLLSTVSASVEGELFAVESQTLGARHLRADCGRGMFATMASAFLAPKIREWEGQRLNLQKFTQRDMTVESLQIETQAGDRRLRILLSA